VSVEATSRRAADRGDGSKMLLLQPFLLGDLELRNKVVMAPLTRTRATLPDAIPNPLMREYYAQRATAGLIVTEGTFVSDQTRGWFGAPGVYTETQRKGWQSITDAVHSAGGRIVVQLWHQGSVSSSELLGNARTPKGPSAVNPEQLIHKGYSETELSGMPAEMTLDDVRQAVQDFRRAAKVALDAPAAWPDSSVIPCRWNTSPRPTFDVFAVPRSRRSIHLRTFRRSTSTCLFERFDFIHHKRKAYETDG
jgi:NADH:flavin oxidoreductase/NADH oxidase family protein